MITNITESRKTNSFEKRTPTLLNIIQLRFTRHNVTIVTLFTVNANIFSLTRSTVTAGPLSAGAPVVLFEAVAGVVVVEEAVFLFPTLAFFFAFLALALAAVVFLALGVLGFLVAAVEGDLVMVAAQAFFVLPSDQRNRY